jgi:hypothetical protein
MQTELKMLQRSSQRLHYGIQLENTWLLLQRRRQELRQQLR